MSNSVRELYVIEEAARALQITPGRVRQIIKADQDRQVQARRFPSARKATTAEESALRADKRIRGIPYSGILVVAAADVEALRSRERRGGRPKEKHRGQLR